MASESHPTLWQDPIQVLIAIVWLSYPLPLPIPNNSSIWFTDHGWAVLHQSQWENFNDDITLKSLLSQSGGSLQSCLLTPFQIFSVLPRLNLLMQFLCCILSSYRSLDRFASISSFLWWVVTAINNQLQDIHLRNGPFQLLNHTMLFPWALCGFLLYL